MKKIILLSVLLINTVCFGQSINVPDKLDINEKTGSLDKVERNGFSIALAGDEKEIIKSFEAFLEDEKKYEVKSLFKKISAENILVPSFSEKHFNLNAQVKESGSELVLWYWVSFETDIYVNSSDHPDEAAKCKELLREFAKRYYTDFINEDLKKSREELDKSEEELEDVKEEIVDLNKDEMKIQKEMNKLNKKKLKLEEELAEIEVELKENALESEKQDETLTKLTTQKAETTKKESEIKSKIAEQEKTMNELKQKLELINAF